MCQAYAMIVTARIGQQDWPAALAANEEGRACYPEDAEPLFQAGLVYQELGRFDDARRTLERLIEGEEDPHYRSVDAGLRTYRGRHELALLFRRMGSFAHSAEVLRDIAEGAPHSLPAQLDLVEVLCLTGNRAEADDRWAAIPPLPELAAPLTRLHRLLNGTHTDLEPPRPGFGRGGRG